MTRLPADIGVDHGGIGDDCIGLAVGDNASSIHADQPFDDANENMHDVLDPDDRQAARRAET